MYRKRNISISRYKARKKHMSNLQSLYIHFASFYDFVHQTVCIGETKLWAETIFIRTDLRHRGDTWTRT